MKKSEVYTELSIQLATLDLKLNKILEMLNKPEITYEIKTPAMTAKSVQEFLNNPPQWPNESHIDYLKRIGQYNEASSLESTNNYDLTKPYGFTHGEIK